MSLLNDTAHVARTRRRAWGRRPDLVRAEPASALLVLGLVQLLRDRPLWYDEAYSHLASSVPVSTLLQGIWHRTGVVSYLMDVPPSFNGPFYLVLHVWVAALGGSAFSLRLQSLLCAVGAVWVLGQLARRLAGPEAAQLCGFLLALNPLLLTETTQARDYGVALLATALCASWLHEWTTTGRHGRRAVLAAVAAALLHWFTIPVMVGFAAYSWLQPARAARRRMSLMLLLACVPAAVLVGWSVLGGTYGSPHPVAVGLALPVMALRDWSGGLTILAVGLSVAAGVGVARSAHRALLLCWFAVPMVLITGAELVRPTYFPRYLLFTLVVLAVAAALGTASITSRPLRRTVAGLLVALSLVATVPTLRTGAREPVPQVLSLLTTTQATGEPIVPADGRVALDLETEIAPTSRLRTDIVLPPDQFTDQTTSSTVWLVRVVLKENSLPVVAAEQRLADAGWHLGRSTLIVGASTDLRIERWTR